MLTSSAKRRKVDPRAVVSRLRPRQELARLSLLPPAVRAVQPELLLDVSARERLADPAAHMGLSLLHHTSIAQLDADMPREPVRVRILRIDLVAHLPRQREQARIAHPLLGERV